MIPLHMKTVDGKPPTKEQVEAVMKLVSDPDAILREASERRQRGIDLLKRLAEHVGQGERASTSHILRVHELISDYRAFAVSLEMLEALAQHIETMRLRLSAEEATAPIPSSATVGQSSLRYF